MSGSDIVLGVARAFGVYVVAGLVFAAAFCLRGAQRVDPAARGATWGFRLLIAPGVAAFWPLLAVRWLRGSGLPPEEKTAHKLASRGARP